MAKNMEVMALANRVHADLKALATVVLVVESADDATVGIVLPTNFQHREDLALALETLAEKVRTVSYPEQGSRVYSN
jgi:hypothetical protein